MRAIGRGENGGTWEAVVRGLERVEGEAAVKEEVRRELGRWRTEHEENMRVERAREMSMDEFEKRYG